jgi:hypothetical protein
MSNTHIVSSKVFEQFKQRARKIKQSEGIADHEALERVAKSAGFDNWHQVTMVAADSAYAETAHRSGLIVALDIKHAMEYQFDRDGLFVYDDRLYYFCNEDLFQHYRLCGDDEGQTFESRMPIEELREEFDMACNEMLYRYTGPILPEAMDDVFKLSFERCFFGPVFVWFKGKFIDVSDYARGDGLVVHL